MYPHTTSVMPTPNLPLLRKALDWATAEDEKTEGFIEWNQSAWARATDCGTSYCIAGWVAATSPAPGDEVTVTPHELIVGQALEVNGDLVSFAEYAGTRLGLTEDEAEDLFDAANDLDDLREIAGRIAARAGEVL